MVSPVAGLTPDMWFYWFVGFATRYSDDEAARLAEEHVPTIGTAPEQRSLPQAAHSPDGLCEGADSTRPDIASAKG